MAPDEEFPNEGTGTSYPGAQQAVIQMLTPDGGECWVNAQDKEKYLADGYKEPGAPKSKRRGRTTEDE